MMTEVCLSLSWIFIAMRGLSLVVGRGAIHCGVQVSHCGGFSCCREQGYRCTGFSSCDTQAYLLHSMWDFPGPGIKPVSPALAGRFLTTRPPGKPYLV